MQSNGAVSGWQFHEQTEVLTPGGIIDEDAFSRVEPAAGESGTEEMPAIPVLDGVPVDEVESELDPTEAYPDTAEPLEQGPGAEATVAVADTSASAAIMPAQQGVASPSLALSPTLEVPPVFQ